MAFIDGTVVNVALPALQQSLNASVLDAQWVVESYALLLAALLLVGGSLGDRYGRRAIFAAGVTVFAVSSIACGLSATVAQLIVARAFQGVGGALLVPGSLSIIGASFDEKKRGLAIGTWSAFTSITAAIGPVIGGWLIEHATWRAAFFLNVPIAVVVLLIVFWRVPESRGDTIDRIDLAGAVLATAGLGSLIYGLIESSGEGWGSVPVVASLSAGVILLTAFVLVETRSKHPMLPLALFKSLNFSGANLLTLLLYAPLTGGLFFFPLNLIQVQKYSATQSGAALLPFILLMFLLSRWSGGLVTRYGARLPLTVGPLIAAVGFCLFTIPSVGVNYWSGFLPAVLVLGLGMAISVAPLTTTVMSAVEPEQSGIASGVNNAVSRTAGVLAIAVFGVVMLWVFSGALERRLSDVPISSELRQTLMSQRVRLAGIEPPGDVQPEARLLVEDAIARSFVRGFRAVMFAAAGSAALSGVFAYMMIEGRGGRRRGEWETR